VQIEYDPNKTSYSDLLKIFWKADGHDPTFNQSRQYMSAIFYHNDEQRRLAEKSRDEYEKEKQKKTVTEIIPAGTFYNAEP